MFHTVYKTINKVNNFEYIGVHSTENINDDYLGSGKYLKRAIKKYGKHNFKKEILYICDTKEECYKIERDLVTETYILNENVYNIKPGGYGSLNLKWTDEQKAAVKGLQAGAKNPNFGKGFRQKGKNNGRHRDNFKGNIKEIGRKISESLKKSDKLKRGNNYNSKKYYASFCDEIFDIQKGCLDDFCNEHGLKYTTMYNTLKTKKAITRGSKRGWQLFEGTYNDKKQ
jgi:group I intron endonuclease